jgi:hypothetical protein
MVFIEEQYTAVGVTARFEALGTERMEKIRTVELQLRAEATTYGDGATSLPIIDEYPVFGVFASIKRKDEDEMLSYDLDANGWPLP